MTATARRIVSLAPSATATLSAMDAADALVGVTHNCDYEGAAPAVGGWLTPDLDRVATLDPDLVLTSDALQRDVRDRLEEHGLAVCHVEPSLLSEVVASFETLGRATGRAAGGERLAAAARARVEAVRERVADRPRPTVYCEEWPDPPMAAGNWVPDVVAAAGGRAPLVEAGSRSREVRPDRVAAADPDHVVLHYCGRGDRVDPEAFRERDWAVDAAVHVLHDDLLNQPSPRLIDGLEALAARLHPDHKP